MSALCISAADPDFKLKLNLYDDRKNFFGVIVLEVGSSEFEVFDRDGVFLGSFAEIRDAVRVALPGGAS